MIGALCVRILVIQARLESARRLHKTLALIGGLELVDHVLQRALAVRHVDRVVLATTDRTPDDVLVDHVSNRFDHAVSLYRGSSLDVQSRFIEVAENYGDCNIGRITADDPFKDPELYHQGFEILEASQADYVSIGTKPIPLGLDIEVFTSQALVRSRELYPSPENLEHVTIEMTRQPEFVREHLYLPDLRGTARLTVDYDEDIAFTTRVAENIAKLGGSFDYLTTVAAVNLLPSAESA